LCVTHVPARAGARTPVRSPSISVPLPMATHREQRPEAQSGLWFRLSCSVRAAQRSPRDAGSRNDAHSTRPDAAPHNGEGLRGALARTAMAPGDRLHALGCGLDRGNDGPFHLGKRRSIGVSHAGQDAPPLSATSVAENAGSWRCACKSAIALCFGSMGRRAGLSLARGRAGCFSLGPRR
jgi:hypothetical protein